MDPPRLALTYPESTFCLQEVSYLLAALLPLRFKPETMLEVGMALCWAIWPKKECIKSYEICFANTLNLNDKGPSMK